MKGAVTMKPEMRNEGNASPSRPPSGPSFDEIDEILRMAEAAFEGGKTGASLTPLRAEASAGFKPIIERLERMSALTESAVKLGKSGNGWAPERLVEVTYQVEPISVEEAKLLATHSRIVAFLNRIRLALRLAPKPKQIVGGPVVVNVPVWYAEGFHECYYLRTSSYKVDVSPDVVAVEVEGRTRDLRVGYQGRRLVPDAIARRLQRLGSMFLSQSKYFYIDEVIELAKVRTQASLYVSGDGAAGEMLDEIIDPEWKSRRIFDESELSVPGAIQRNAPKDESRGRLIERFREKTLRMPTDYREILSNLFEVTAFSLYYVPYYYLRLANGNQTREVVIHGVTGRKAENGTAKFVGRIANLGRQSTATSSPVHTAS